MTMAKGTSVSPISYWEHIVRFTGGDCFALIVEVIKLCFNCVLELLFTSL